MKVVKLTKTDLDEFKAYLIKHRFEHDESFLYDDDIEGFQINNKQITNLLIEDNQITGTISLMLDDWFLRGGKSRIRIFHCEKGTKERYKILLDSIPVLDESIKHLELFMPSKNENVINIFYAIGFDYYRTTYVMKRENKENVDIRLPNGFELRDFVSGQDEQAYAKIRNRAFEKIEGNNTPITIDEVREHVTSKDVLVGGVKMVMHGNLPIGLVRMSLEEEAGKKYAVVAPIAIVPEFQGCGLGLELLKCGIIIGAENGLNNAMLVVNSENEKALGLYKKAGFEVDFSVVSMRKPFF